MVMPQAFIADEVIAKIQFYVTNFFFIRCMNEYIRRHVTVEHHYYSDTTLDDMS